MTDRARIQPFTVLFKTMHQALRVELDQALKKVDLTVAQLGVMAALASNPGASNAELARAAFVTPQSMGELLAALSERKLIERVPSRKNARVLKTSLTPLGFRTLVRGGEQASKVEYRLVSALSAEDQRTMRRIIERCLESLAAPAAG